MSEAVVGALFDEFVQGGLLDDADVLVKLSRFSSWDYNGKQPTPVLAIKLVMVDGENNEHEQYLSSGEMRFFVPSPDGTVAIPVGAQKKLNLNTNAVAFLLSVMNADTQGQLAAALKATGNVSLLEGVRMHVVRKAQPKRTGLIQAPGTEGQPQREKTQLLCEKILAYAGQAAPPAGVKAAAVPAATAAAAAPAAAVNSELDDLTVGALLTLLSENGNSLKPSAIAGKFFGAAAFKAGGSMPLEGPVKNSVLGLIVKPEFINAPGRPWTVGADGTISLG